MNGPTLKADLHKIIDELEDESLLQKFHQELLTMVSHSQRIWETLSNVQQQEVLKSLEESKDHRNLLDHEEVMAKYDQWL